MNQLYAVINPRSPRYERFVRYVGSDSVPILPTRRERVNLIGTGEDVRCYFADLAALRLEPGRFERLIASVVEERGGTSAEVLRQMEKHGFPVIADDVVVCLDPELGRLAFNRWSEYGEGKRDAT